MTETSDRTVPVRLGRARRLSPMQRALLASQLANPDHPSQNTALLSHLEGEIDATRLADAFASVVAANDVLRTRLGGAGTDAFDAVDLFDPEAIPATEIIEADRSDFEATSRLRAARTIDLTVCPWDSVIARHPDGTASWYLNLHHVVTDATSSAMVFQATASVYHGLEPASSGSYYEWTNRLSRSIEEPDGPTAKAIDHWRDRDPAPRIGRLYRAPDRPDPSAHRLPLDLGDLASRAEASLNGDLRMLTEHLGWSTLLVTATALWAHRLTGADRFAIGLPVHNRNDAESRGLVGPVMEVFPVDIELSPDDTARTLHKRVGRSIMRTLSRAVPGTAPAADHEIVVNVIPRADQSSFGPIPAVTSWLHPGAIDGSHLARVQMTAYAGDQADGAAASGWDFAIDLNDGAADPDHRLLAPTHLARALAAIVDEPDTPLAGWSLPTEVELATLQRWGHGADFDTPTTPVVTALRQALADNAEVVVVDDDRSLTGPELLAWIDATAGWLHEHGVGPGARVGVDLPRSMEAVVAIAATLEAGGSFVPLDPAQPAARRQRLAERAGCVLVIGSTDTIAATRPDTVPTPITPTAPAGTGRPEDDQEQDEAYVIFTSGSTGEPKGVPITRLGLARYLRFAAQRYCGGDRPPVVAPLFSPLTFDLTITTLFLPLLTGGQLVVVPEDGPLGLATVARRTEITWIKATPSHLEILTRLLPDDHALTTVVVGGEAFGTRLAAELLAANPDREIHNEYGPTEAVVGCMDYRVEPELLGHQTEVPIGAPAPGVELAVVDRYGHRVPIGSPGELWISHPGLTPGYLIDAELADPDPGGTPDDPTDGPFVTWEGRRWYRSGDLVRLQDPERLVYLGRIDEQIKVGGVRLEPMEVEEALAAHPAVDSCAVRLWSPSSDDPSSHCVRCGLPDNIPGVAIDDAGVCDTCHDYDRVAPVAESWFRNPDDLAAVRERVATRKTGDYDCLHLLSGGKDSTYALYQLVELGFRPYSLTLDNGFISEGAKDNVRRSIADLGIDHEFVTLDAMNEIFRDSLERHSNVCHGCYKAIYTVATNRADQLGIPLIVTGLSRGQLFETRLIPQQFSTERFDPEAIDRAVLEARKAYHRLDDGPNRLLDTDVFAHDEIFDRIEYLDFYRYVDVELAEMLDFLENRAPWVRPADTGRSTNCLVNAAGIHTHQTEQGYHNYAVPYAWDVRLGHKTRQEAIEELDDQLDLDEVDDMLSQIGYRPRPRQILTAWMVPSTDAGTSSGPDGAGPTPAELRAFLGQTLPSHAIPSAFVTIDDLPLSTNGKLDTTALPRPKRVHRSGPTLALSPTTPTEEAVIEVWEQVLATEPISVDDEFFALGGDSLAALEMIVALGERLGHNLSEDLAFANATPRALAEAIDAATTADTDPAGFLDGDPSEHQTPPDAIPARSDGELAILFDQSNRPDDVMYNVARLYRVADSVDGESLAEALRAEAAEHQPLTWTHGNPRRPLAPARAVSVRIENEPVTDSRLDELADELNRQPFDLDRGPLLRALVQPVDDGTTGVVLAIHHASGDAGSFDRLWRRVEHRLAGTTAPDLTVDYAGFCAWQATHQDAAALHWLDLGRRGPAATLAIHRPDQPEPDGFLTRVASVDIAALRAGTRKSPAAIALGALAAAVGAHSDPPTGFDSAAGTDETIPSALDVEIGLITSTRNHPAAAELFGYFLNTLPVRVAIDGGAGDGHSTGPTMSELVDRAGDAVGGALANRAYSRARIAADRRREGLPVPQLEVLMAWDELEQLSFGDATVDQRVLWNGTAVAPLTFFAEARGDRLDLSVEWQGNRVPAQVATTLLALWDRAIATAVTSPSHNVEEILAVGLDELGARAHIDGGDPIAGPGVIELIMGHLATPPAGAAVEVGGQSASWSDLNRRSGAVAAELAGRNIGSGDRVAVVLPRSVELLDAIVGVLRAGAAYVPVDPSYPADRIAQVLSGSRAAAVLIGPDVDLSDVTVDGLDSPIVVETDRFDGKPWPDEAPAVTATTPQPDDEAYLIFTSGSTGRPRGVPVSHGHLSVSTAARQQVYPSAPERFLVPSSPAFDSSIVGLFWTLSAGGTVVLPSERQVHDLDALIDLLGTVDHCLLVPTLYRAMLDRAGQRSVAAEAWPSRVIVAGESCPPSLVDTHHRRFSASGLTNEYGPTEATVWATAHHCQPGDDPVPLGPPIPGARLAVIDHAGTIRPTGVEGQLVIGGAGVVGGYLDEPAATEAAFGPYPGTAAEPSFRTGDRVVVADGQLLFVGRGDDRLNVGGVRAEPEEIERVLNAVDGVTAAIAVAADLRTRDELLDSLGAEEISRALTRAADHTDPATALLAELQREGRPDLRLVAHIESVDGVDQGELRKAANRGLATNLRPAHYVIHHQLPRTPNGKLDRTAAADLALGDRMANSGSGSDVDSNPGLNPAGEASPPGTGASEQELLARLTSLFATALRLGDLGPDDSFFDHGGHSLLAMELALAIEDDLGSRLPVTDLYDHPSPRALAHHLAETSPVRSTATAPTRRSFLVPIQPEGTQTPIFAIHVLGVDCAFFRPLAARLGPDQPMFGLGQPTADLDTSGPTDVTNVAASYVAEIDQMVPEGPIRLAAISLGGVVAYELAQQLAAKGRDVELLALFDALGPELASVAPPKQWIAAQLARASTDPGRYLREQADRQWQRVVRTTERGGLAVQRKLGLRTEQRLEIRRFIEDNVQAQLGYHYEPYPGRLLVLKAGDDPLAPAQAEAGMGWRPVALGGVDVDIVPGGHLSMMEEPHVDHVASALIHALTTIDTARAGWDGGAASVSERFESALARAVQAGNLPVAMAKLRPVAEPGSPDADLLDRLDALQVDLATVADEVADRVVALIVGAGVDARALPGPTRMTFPMATIEVSSGRSSTGSVTRALAEHGFRAIDVAESSSPAGDAQLQGRVDYLAPDGTARVQIRWPWVERSGRLYRAVRKRADNGLGSDLGILLGTPRGLVGPLLATADIGHQHRIVDLGCGDGRVLIEAAQLLGCHGVGYELDPGLADIARGEVKRAGVSDLVEIVTGDARSAEVGHADLVFAFLPAAAIGEILEPSLAAMRPGAIFLSHEQHRIPVARPPDRQHLVMATGGDPSQGGLTVANLWVAGPAIA